MQIRSQNCVKAIKLLILMTSVCLFPIVTNASIDKVARNEIKVNIIVNTPRHHVQHFPEKKIVRLDDTINFDIMLSCSNCEFKKIDIENSTLKGLYPKQRYVNGRIEDVAVKEDILSTQPYMHYNNRLFRNLNMRKDSAVITYMDGNIKIGDVYQYEIHASIDLEVLFHDHEETVQLIEGVVLKDSQNRYVRTEKGKILFALSPNGSSTTLNAERYFDFKITGQNKVFRQMSILENEKEIFLDNRLFGGVLKLGAFSDNGHFKKDNSTLFFPEKYFNKSVDLKLYYSKITLKTIVIKKTATTNILDFIEESNPSTGDKIKNLIDSIWERF